MATERTKRTIVLPILPVYADGIMNGSKRVEFRKRNVPIATSRVVLYATLPVGRVVGVIEVVAIHEVEPTIAWSQYSSIGGIEQTEFFEYYKNTPLARVLKIANPIPLNVDLSTLVNMGIRISQGFSYISDEQLEKMVELSATFRMKLPI